LNGRPEKLEDVSDESVSFLLLLLIVALCPSVHRAPGGAPERRCDGAAGRADVSQVCYSWWDLAGMSVIGRLEWINRDKLIDFILGAQVGPNGSDRSDFSRDSRASHLRSQ
jgi:hypothetical protein